MTTPVHAEPGSVLADLLEVAALAQKAALRVADEVVSCSTADLTSILRVREEASSALASLGLSAVREVDVRGLAQEAGQSSTAMWLAHVLRVSPGEGSARVKDADTACRKSPALGDALATGAINAEQARTIAAGLRTIDKVASADEYTAAERRLLMDAKSHDAKNLRKLADHIAAVLDPNGPGERDERARQERALTIINLGNGRHRVRGILTEEGAAGVNAALDLLAAPRPAADGERDPRTASQRRADALTDMAARFLRFGDLGESRGERPQVTITVTAETLNSDGAYPFARAATGEDLSPEVARKICCDARLTPIVVTTLGQPLSVGRSTRIWPTPIWKALVARDVGCVFPGCTRPASWTQAHHIKHWIDGGETSLSNGALVCDFHHDQIHHAGWQIRLAEDGHPELIPPPWIDSSQRPQRNAHWKLAREGLKTDPDRGP